MESTFHPCYMKKCSSASAFSCDKIVDFVAPTRISSRYLRYIVDIGLVKGGGGHMRGQSSFFGTFSQFFRSVFKQNSPNSDDRREACWGSYLRCKELGLKFGFCRRQAVARVPKPVARVPNPTS